MDLARFPRRRYTHAPTPIEPLPHFTKALAALCPGGVGPDAARATTASRRVVTRWPNIGRFATSAQTYQCG